MRRLVTQALVQQTAPDERTAALIALLHALKREHKVVDPRDSRGFAGGLDGSGRRR